MNKAFKKWLAVLSAIALLATTGVATAFAANADEITYDFKQYANAYISATGGTIAYAPDYQYDGVKGLHSEGAASDIVYAVPTTKSFKVTGHVGFGNTEDLKFAISNDTVNWTSVTPETVLGADGTPIWSQNSCDYTYTGDVAFRYIKITLGAKSNFGPAICNVYAAIEDTKADAYEVTVQPDDASAAVSSETGTLQVHGGSFHAFFNADATKTEAGTITFKSDYPITDLLVRTLLYKDTLTWMPYGGDITYSVSSDGVAFRTVKLLREKGADHNGSWGSAYFDDYVTFNRDENVKYVRVEMGSTGASSVLPALDYVSYNAETPKKAESYEYVVKAADMAQESEGTLGDSNGSEIPADYKCFKDSTGVGVPGTFTLQSASPITDLLVSVAQPFNVDHTDGLSFSVSTDGVTYREVSLLAEQTGDHYPYAYGDWYTTFFTSEKIYYVKVAVNSSYGWNKAPALKSISYNAVKLQKADSYAVTLTPSEENVEGVNTFGVSAGSSAHYSLFNEAGKIDEGAFLFFSKETILDLYIPAMHSYEGWNGGLKFFASSDGIYFDELKLFCVDVAQAGADGWHARHYDYFTSFEDAQDIHYIRVQTTANGANDLFPAIKNVQLNTKVYVKPNAYTTTLNAMQYTNVEKEDGVIAKADIDEIKNHGSQFATFFVDNGNAGTGSGTSAVGRFIYQSEKPITDYNFVSITSNVGWGGDFTYYASKDGKNWDVLTPIKEKEGGSILWDCGKYNNYGCLDAADGYYYLAAQNPAGSQVQGRLPTLGNVQYNVGEPVPVLEKGNSLTVGENVDVNFHIQLSKEVLADENLKVTVGGKEIAVEDVAKDANGNYVFPFEVPAKQMNDIITATVAWGDGNKEEYSYSVREYCEAVLASPLKYYKELPLVKAMLNYGAYAQTYFNHNTDNLANYGVENNEAIDAITADAVAAAAKTDLPADLFGASLLLRSETTLKFYFKTNSAVTVNGVAAELVLNGNLWQLSVPGITAKNLDEEITIVKDGVSFTFSPLSYVHKALSSETTSDALKGVMKALYLYNAAANTYAGE